MDLQGTLITIILFAGISWWFYLNTTMEIDYRRHPQLIDTSTGVKRKPSELLDLAKIINWSPEYIESTDAEQRLHDLIYYSNFENPFLVDQTYSSTQDLKLSAWPIANQALCFQDLNWIIDKLNTHKNYTQLKGQLGYELTSFMDSFGRPEPGVYSGVTNWMGSYKQCTKGSLNNGSIKTRFCIGRMRFERWPGNETIYPPSSIRIGMCLPETCDTLSFGEHRSSIEQLAKFELPESFKENLEFQSLFCLPDERSPLRKIPPTGYAFIFVVGGWLLLVLIASLLYEYLRCQKRKIIAVQSAVHLQTTPLMINIKQQSDDKVNSPNSSTMESVNGWVYQLLEAISIRHNLKQFKTNSFRVKYNRGERVKVDLGALDFFKITMAFAVVLGHSGFIANTNMRSLSNRIELNVSDTGRMGLSVSRVIDTFFLFFGVLTAYTSMRKFTTKQLYNPLVWLGVIVCIFLRITPLFMLVYWYSRSVSPYTNSGPWWDYGVDEFSMKGVCMRDSWWKSIPYFGCLGTPPVPTCNLPAWFIVSYSQMSIIMPVIIYIICKLPNYVWRCILVAGLLLVSASNIGLRLYTQTSVKEEGFTLYGGLLSDLLEKFESTGHITTLGRVGSVTVGCFVGYLLRMYEVGKITEWPKWLRNRLILSTVVAIHLILIFLPMLGYRIFLYTGRMAGLAEFVSASMVLIFVWPILNSILLIASTTVYNHTVIVRFLSHTFWHVLNRLGYGIYLVHWEVLYTAFTGYEQAPTYGFMYDVMKMWAYGASFSILIAFAIYITFESPLANLIAVIAKPLLGSNNNGSERTSDTVVDHQHRQSATISSKSQTNEPQVA